MQLVNAKEAFILSKEISGLSPNTIRNYKLTLRRLAFQLGGERDVAEISHHELLQFLHRLQTKGPEDFNRPRDTPKPLGPKSIKNVHGNLSSFWNFLKNEGVVQENIVQRIDAPQPQAPTIEPFTKIEILALLATTQKAKSEELRKRDYAILLFLLDTAVRNSELRRLKVEDVDMTTYSAKVTGKGRRDSGRGKERVVYFSEGTAKAIRAYLRARGQDVDPKDFLFVTQTGKQFKRDHLTQRVKRLGEKAGIEAYPHKFRHTAAIQALRNGMNIYALQRMLGHTSLDMTKRYLAIAQSDVEEAHRRASPVERWGL